MHEDNQRKNTQETMVALVSREEHENSNEVLQPNGSKNEIEDGEQKQHENGKNENGGTMPSVNNLNSNTHASIATSTTVVT